MKRISVFAFAAVLGLWPGVSQAYVQGDPCPAALAGQVMGNEPIAGGFAALVCDGANLQYQHSFEHTPLQMGIATNDPAVTLDVNGEVRPGNTSIACSATTEGAIRYNSSGYHEFCDGTNWRQFVGVQSATPPTAPAGAGYFVMTATTWNGNLGGLNGADSKCLTELSTTYTDWNGYSDANSRGLLDSTHVKSFICDNTSSCNELMPLTTYYFAAAGNASAGGASFTTDSSGKGPQDNAIWSAANYFSGSYEYWTGRTTTNSTLWSTGPGSSSGRCNQFNTTGDSGIYGNAGNTGGGRWNTGQTGCNNTKSLICFVNP
ncbi:MAG: hypothetical protein ACU85E_15055 [Gammaproteobacteria bacterium]